MGVCSLIHTVTISALAPFVAVAGAGPALADPPSVGDACSEFRATTQDTEGRTMSCNHTTTGDHSLVWQYGDSSDQDD
jgi:hypothetical protein